MILLGDSDIAYWPEDLHPTFPRSIKQPSISSGHSGATLRDLAPPLDLILNDHGKEELLFVICAGENDMGEGLSLDQSVGALEKLLEMIIESSPKHKMIFLGPKFEPWQENDMRAKEKYSKMSRSFQRCLSRQDNADFLHYIDCLTMFCGQSAMVAGAVLGGRASAEYKYFRSDLLHLSVHGYRIWKEVVEQKIKDILDVQ